MSSLAIIVIIVLLAAFIYMWAKCQSLQKEVHSKENKENELKKLALVLQNINAYFLLIDKDFKPSSDSGRWSYQKSRGFAAL